jgi:hypothetical protein
MPDITSPLNMIDDIIRRNRGRKRMLLIEMKKNLEMIGLLDEGVPIDQVILSLETTQLEKAFDSGFDFNSFRLLKPKVSASIVRENAFYHRYIGWTFDRLFENIYIKIDTLKKIAEIKPRVENINRTARLNNILRLITLLLLHIDKQK